MKFDTRWLEAFKAGEEWGFQHLYKSLHDPVARFLSRRVGDTEVARDLTQEVFLKLHRFREAFVTDVAATHAFVFRVARNTATDWFRGTATEREQVRALGADEDFDDFEAPEGHARADARIEASEKRGLFRQWLKKLTDSQRRVVWLRLVRGLSFEEIADQLGMSSTAAKCLLHRAKGMVPA